MKASNFIVWIDCEMTGLYVDTDVLLEIATIITDNNLNEIVQGPSLVIHQPDAVLSSMHIWCRTQHGASGLTQAVRQSTVSLEQAEQETLACIMTYCEPNTAVL